MRLSAKLLILFAICGLTSCGFPGNELTKEERVADMKWAFTIFEHNYAPAQLKKDTLGVDLEVLRDECVGLAESEQTNSEFIGLFQRCVHSVKDAHVSAAQMNNGLLPEFAQIAHLGFVTGRTKYEVNGTKSDALRVLAQLPGSVSPLYPVQKGDLITHVNGKPVAEYLQSELVPYINVGQAESDLTIAAFRFAVRVSIEQAIPAEDDITLTVVRGSDAFDTTLPWVKEDLVAFQEKQQSQQPEPQPEEPLGSIKFENGLAQTVFGYDVLEKIFAQIEAPIKQAGNRVMAILKNTFRMTTFNPIMKLIFDGDLGAEIPERLINRHMESALKIEPILADQLLPAAFVTDEAGNTFAYIQISSFPGADEFVLEVNRLFATINAKEVKSLVLDMIDNGGGSLIHGMRFANNLRAEPIALPSIQIRLNNNWVNSFRAQAYFGATDAEKLLAKRLLTNLQEDMQAGLTLSRPISITSLDPFALQQANKIQCVKNGTCLLPDTKVAVVVNEMCVSMCDIFADTIKDNDLGLVIGQKTMGGGGNVSGHALSPVSKMMLNLTESLIVSAKGEKYLENTGVEPDLYVDMVTDRENNFQSSLDVAYRYVTGQLAPTPVPVPAPENL